MICSNKNLITFLLISIIIFSVCATSYAASKYTIQWGDSLSSISHKHNTSVSTLAKENKIKNPDMIYSGSTLKIPDTTKDNPSKTKDNTTKKDSNTYTSDNWLSEDNLITNHNKNKKSQKVYRKSKTNTMQIALTFDDGPDNLYTPQILKILKEYNVKATFFLMGQQVQKYPKVTKQIIKNGHTIGNHSWSHPNLTQLDKKELKNEVLKTEKHITEITNVKPTLIRPPYGAVSDKMLKQLKSMNYKVIHWSIDSLDWNSDTKKEILNRVLPKLNPGAIILFHSSIGKSKSLTPTVKALPKIIETLKKKNIKLVTINKLLSLPAYKR